MTPEAWIGLVTIFFTIPTTFLIIFKIYQQCGWRWAPDIMLANRGLQLYASVHMNIPEETYEMDYLLRHA
ncbi:hypothetical protein CC78DRAFT_536853 [Lojkania enalia]|uniref:Uncharacterized protein n=1 Tax=Lojkania enalia TaxID=147567 RepID=A0A9P4K2N9_9PLEO|nr:hypothetical protein CC78DRAFT_536853 [Didymosphaeria enalia]